jgi:subtilisin family serine protease
MNQTNYRVTKTSTRSVLDKLPSRVEHAPEAFGFPAIDGDGRGVRICIIDTGFPFHTEIAVPMTNVVDFTNSEVAQDKHGHGSGIAGIIKAKGPNLVGLAPMADVFYAKALGGDGEGNHGSVQAAILYAIVKTADIIVMAFGSESIHPVLHEAIRKAYDRGSSIFAASGVMPGGAKDAEYPARFQEVMSVGFSAVKTPRASLDGVYNIDFPSRSVETLHLENQFVKMSGTSVMAPVAAGVAARIIQRRKAKREDISPQAIYQEMMALCSGD